MNRRRERPCTSALLTFAIPFDALAVPFRPIFYNSRVTQIETLEQLGILSLKIKKKISNGIFRFWTLEVFQDQPFTNETVHFLRLGLFGYIYSSRSLEVNKDFSRSLEVSEVQLQ